MPRTDPRDEDRLVAKWKGDCCGGWDTRYTCENSPVPTRSTFSNLEVRLESTSVISGAFMFKLGRFEKLPKYSLGPVGVAGRKPNCSLPLRVVGLSCLPEIDSELGSGGKIASLGVRGEERSSSFTNGDTGERANLACLPTGEERETGGGRKALERRLSAKEGPFIDLNPMTFFEARRAEGDSSIALLLPSLVGDAWMGDNLLLAYLITWLEKRGSGLDMTCCGDGEIEVARPSGRVLCFVGVGGSSLD